MLEYIVDLTGYEIEVSVSYSEYMDYRTEEQYPIWDYLMGNRSERFKLSLHYSF